MANNLSGADTAEVIESGGLDVLETRGGDGPRRRWPWVAALACGVLIAAAVVEVPRLRAANVTSNLRWFRDTWASAETYDAARSNALNAVLIHTVPGDEAIYRSAVVAVDHQELTVLSHVTAQVARHGAGAGDVTRLRARMVSALRSEAAAVTADPPATKVSLHSLAGIPGRWTQEFLDVDQLLFRTLTRHRVSATSHPTAMTFTAGDKAAALLRHVIDQPLSGWVVVSGPELPAELIRLPDGATRALPQLPPNGPDGVIGTTAYYFDVRAQEERLVLVGLLDGKIHTIRHVRGFAGAGTDHLWLQLDGGTVEQVDLDGRVTVQPHRAPPNVVLVAATESAVLMTSAGDPPVPTIAWEPTTGRTHRYSTCTQFRPATRTAVLVLNVSCDFESSTVTFAEPLTGNGPKLKAPRGYVFVDDVRLSPDGRRLAVSLQHPSTRDASPTHLGVLDLRTHKWTLIRTDANIRGWSKDSAFVFLSAQSDNSVRLLVWSDAVPRPTYLRLPSDAENFWLVPGESTVASGPP
jgi:hypothetical protein